MTSNVPVLAAGSAAAAAAATGKSISSMPSPFSRGGDRGRTDVASQEDENGRDRDGRRTDRKRKHAYERERNAVILDEVAPKETGRQAIMVRSARGF